MIAVESMMGREVSSFANTSPASCSVLLRKDMAMD